MSKRQRLQGLQPMTGGDARLTLKRERPGPRPGILESFRASFHFLRRY
jgi:hypothetical protein